MTAEEEVAAARRRAERWLANRDGDGPEDGGSIEPEEVLEPTPGAAVLARLYAQQAEPYVREVREKVFGSPDPPFSDPADAERWYVGARLRGRIPEEFVTVTLELVKATGFRERDVKTWILMGDRPKLHRAVLHIRENAIPGTSFKCKRAFLEINAPIEEREVRSIWRRGLSKLWRQDGGTEDVLQEWSGRQKKLTEKDEALYAIVEQMPLESEFTWKDRVEEWPERLGTTTSAAIRKRWQRLQEKLDALTPEENDG